MKNPAFVFVDLETTGLDEVLDFILEVGIIIADERLQITEAMHWVLALPPTLPPEQWGPGVREFHTKNRLIQECSAQGDDPFTVETDILDHLNRSGIQKGAFPMCGNSVHFDRRFLRAMMPNLEAHFHYRNIDVSTLKELCKKWYGTEAPTPEFKPHRAVPDLEASIKELRWYHDNLLVRELPGSSSPTAAAPVIPPVDRKADIARRLAHPPRDFS